jgi:FAD-linked sulfhydryl oxidase
MVVKLKKTKYIEPDIWGPPFWFFLHTVAYKYPNTPNAIIKRKYYDLVVNFPLFIPDEKMGDLFATLLDKYPVSPYLDTKESFMRWVWFIHNKINAIIGKEEIGLYESFDAYVLKIKKPTIYSTFYSNIYSYWKLLWGLLLLLCISIVLALNYKNLQFLSL